MAGTFVPKDKKSRQKLRRYTFAAEMALENGQKHQFKVPGMVYGNHEEALAISTRLLDQFKTGDANATDFIKVIPVAHETVSIETKNQLEGLNNQGNLAHKALLLMCERYRIASGTELGIDDLAGQVIEEAREHLFPRLREAKEKMASLDKSVTETASDTPVDSPKRTRKIGIDAVNEILNSPVEA